MSQKNYPGQLQYEKYCKAACKWCRDSPIVWIRGFNKDHEWWHYDELGNAVERCLALGVFEWAEQLAANLEQVDDVLIGNWITAKDNDYRKALADLVTWEIQIRDDPALNGITGVAMRHRETKEVFSMGKPARHDSLIHKLVELGVPDFAKGEQGFVDVGGNFLTREDAFTRAARTGQLNKRTILFSEDLW
jgi:hypothetical protein